MNDMQLKHKVNQFKAIIKPSSVKYKQNNMNYDTEEIFAVQHLTKNDYIEDVAARNPNSVLMAMYNAANIGITLNPVEKLAYLVPRDGKIILDVSYIGLINLAVKRGSIKWAKAHVVRENDAFELKGPAEAPTHTYNPFKRKERGEIVGVYCMAELNSGVILCGTMDIEELHKIRDKSTAYKAFTSGKSRSGGPWVDWFEGMALKSIVRREERWWPKCEIKNENPSYSKAIEVLDEAGEGIDFNEKEINITPAPKPTPQLTAAQIAVQATMESMAEEVLETANEYQQAQNGETV